jgi:hypothetical protein
MRQDRRTKIARPKPAARFGIQHSFSKAARTAAIEPGTADTNTDTDGMLCQFGHSTDTKQ